MIVRYIIGLLVSASLLSVANVHAQTNEQAVAKAVEAAQLGKILSIASDEGVPDGFRVRILTEGGRVETYFWSPKQGLEKQAPKKQGRP